MARTHPHRIMAGAALLALAALQQHSAAAHPHVWIDATATLRFDAQHRLVAIDTRWEFDEMFSASEAEGRDTNRDGRISAAEMEPLAGDIVRQLRDWDYMSVLKAAGERVAIGTATAHAMTYEGGRVVLSLTLPLPKPVEPRRGAIRFGMFDPSFYILMAFPEGEAAPIRLAGTPPPECRIAIEHPDDSQPAFIPDDQATAVEPDPNDVEASIGALYADWAVLTCAAAS